MREHRARGRRSRGVAIVEFAIIAPLLFLLVFGIIEFGWVFFQYLDVRNGAREGARFAAVAEDPMTSTQVIDETCDRMEDADSDTDIRLLEDGQASGDYGTITVHRRVDSLTGFLDPLIGDFLDVSSTVRFRIEEDIAWTDQGPEDC